MLSTLARNWWILMLRGVAGVLFGVFTFVWPEVALVALVALLGGFVLFQGISTLVAAWRYSEPDTRGWALFLSGLLATTLGVITFFLPLVTALAMLYWVAAWAILTGILEISAAIALRDFMKGELLLGLSGALSVLFGVLLFANPEIGMLALVLWVGAYACVQGVLFIGLAWQLRKLRTEGHARLTLRPA